MTDKKIDLKVVLLGDMSVGKTYLVNRIVYDKFVDAGNTIGAAYTAKMVKLKSGRELVVGIWDTAGGERYEAMSRLYFRSAKAAIVCYDLTEGKTFERAKFWIGELKSYEESCEIYLCGCKLDLVAPSPGKSSRTSTAAAQDSEGKLPRGVDYHEASDYAESISATYVETSSKTGQNTYQLLYSICEDFERNNQDHFKAFSGAYNAGALKVGAASDQSNIKAKPACNKCPT